jgi:hypothetical protein
MNRWIKNLPICVPFRIPSGFVPIGPPPVGRVVSFNAIFMLIATDDPILDITLNAQARTPTYAGDRDAALH